MWHHEAIYVVERREACDHGSDATDDVRLLQGTSGNLDAAQGRCLMLGYGHDAEDDAQRHLSKMCKWRYANPSCCLEQRR